MYKIILSLFAIVLLSCNNTSTEETSQKEVTPDINSPHTADGIDSSKLDEMGKLVWADTVHDFGTIKQGDVVKWEAEYKNEGKGNIIIQDAYASCGCTVPEFNKEAIKPGETGRMPVTFDSEGKEGHVEKTVTVQTNGFPAVYELTIKADIQ